MILKWIFKKWDGEHLDWIAVAEHREREMADSFECDNEPSGSIKREKFLNYLRTC
jgi:hypothetical protein